MPKSDVEIGGDTDTRPGFDSAVDRFCDAAADKVLGSGNTYLTYATRVELSFAKDPTVYGQLGFVNCELCLDTGVLRMESV